MVNTCPFSENIHIKGAERHSILFEIASGLKNHSTSLESGFCCGRGGGNMDINWALKSWGMIEDIFSSTFQEVKYTTWFAPMCF